MHLHILGICGTFMAGVAQLARELGHTVTGSDAGVYPPMSDFLAASGITLKAGWDVSHLDPRPDLVLIGNALSRGNPLVEATLAARIPYTSGPAWLADAVLGSRHVLAVAGTHGKTTTSSLLTHFLDAAGLAPGFLIGGIPENFGVPARLGKSPFFVIEADEYDTAFFDKRSKFVHYRPSTLVMNNLEFDHADIFPDLRAIQTQFHHLVRTVPPDGLIIVNGDDVPLAEVLARGCWTPRETFGQGADAHWKLRVKGPGCWEVGVRGGPMRGMTSPLAGMHNALNTLAAMAAAHHAGVSPEACMAALPAFRNVKRRLEVVGQADGVTVYDDFAHHPTAISATVDALRQQRPGAPLLAVLEPRSNTMRMGVHRESLAAALAAADRVVVHAPPGIGWDVASAMTPLGHRVTVTHDNAALLEACLAAAVPGTQVLIMSNGAFGGLHQTLLNALQQREVQPS